MAEFGIEFVSTAIKSHALTDFTAEWTPGPQADEEESKSGYKQKTDGFNEHYWSMFFDGSFTFNGSGAGVVLIAPTGEKLRYAIELNFRATNNMAEYEALLAGLKVAVVALKIRVPNVACSDSAEDPSEEGNLPKTHQKKEILFPSPSVILVLVLV